MKAYLSGIILGVSIAVSVLIIGTGNSTAQISAQDIDIDVDIQYPVKELGNCKNEAECRAYCDKPQNIEQCLDFAEENGLIPEDELEMARKFEKAGFEGPGDCTSQASCENYCNDIVNIDECLAFAEENDIMPPDELEEAKKVQAALAGGAKLPGGCRSKDECETYCENPDRIEECIAFAEAAGFLPPEELDEAKKFMEAVKKGIKPPPCKGKRECDVYCDAPGNFEVCIDFAEAAGFISPEEVKMARKTGGVGPGGCRRNECEDFCEKEENLPVCIDFAIEHDLMSPEEAEMARKTGGKGPGNCKGKEECEAFCEDPANGEICFNFAKEHGMIPEDDLMEMEEGRQMMMEGLDQAPPEVAECLKSTVGSEVLDKLRAGTGMPNRELGDKMRECFEKVMGQMGPPERGSGGGRGMSSMPSGVSISLKQTSSNSYEIVIRSGTGVESFALFPIGATPYSGGLSGCPREYKATTVLDPTSFPMQAKIVDCEGNTNEFTLSGEGELRAGGGGQGEEGGESEFDMMEPPEGFEGMMPPQGFEGGPPSESQIKEFRGQVEGQMRGRMEQRTREQIQGEGEQRYFEGIGPRPGTPGIFSPLEGENRGAPPEGFQGGSPDESQMQEFRGQIENQMRGQIEQQMQQQIQQKMMPPSSGEMIPPSSVYPVPLPSPSQIPTVPPVEGVPPMLPLEPAGTVPPSTFMPPPTITPMVPPTEVSPPPTIPPAEFSPPPSSTPPSSTPPPSSSAPRQSLLGNVRDAFIRVIQKIF